MERKPRIPSYRHHKPSGQAVVSLDGRDRYLGRYGTPESRAEYDRLISAWTAHGRRLPEDGPHDLSVAEALAMAMGHVETYYAQTPHEIGKYKVLFAIVRKLFGPRPAASFGPLAVKAIRQVLIDRGHARRQINHTIGRLKRAFRWLAENENIPASVSDGVWTVTALRKGRGGRETPPVRPVDDTVVEATLGHAPPMVQAMTRLQRATGMRSGELVLLRGQDLDTGGLTWLFRPPSHKTSYRDYERVIAIGGRGQEILRPWLIGDPTAYVFSPRRCMELVRADRTAKRRTPAQQGNRVGSHRRRRPQRQPGESYTPRSYYQTIARATDLAFPAPDGLTGDELKAWRRDHRWGPHRLRHAFATEARKAGFGLEVIRAALGHRSPLVTAIYAQADADKAITIAQAIG